LPFGEAIDNSALVHSIEPADVLARATAAVRRTVPGAVVAELEPLEGGVSSLTYACSLIEGPQTRRLVLKIAPPGLPPVRNRDVLRQARALRRLRSLPGFPVPAVVFEDEGDPPGRPPMFGMELAPGEAYEPRLDVAPRPPSPSVAADRMRAAARALAGLQAPTPEELGLGDEPASTVREELDRWERLFSTVDPDIGAGHQDLYARLREHVPEGIAPRVLHGDYRLANMLFVERELTAVIDWEIWSVGDPRFDLAWLLMHVDARHVFHERRAPADVAAGSALPTVQQLTGDYAQVRRRLGAGEQEIAAATTGLRWFLGVGFYKVASTIAAIHKRERKRPDPDPKLAVAARHLHEVLQAGHAVLDSG
jgi:aminoglycoside phosphotransferase (APT) family kinase protein